MSDLDMLAFFQPETDFNPEIIEVLAAAFENAWDRLQKSGNRLARPGYSRATREVIAKRIIEMAQSGIKDSQRLTDDAVRFLCANYRDDRTEVHQYFRSPAVPLSRNCS
jgi:hypothetical protein